MEVANIHTYKKPVREVVIIRQKLTDLERQQIIAEYVAGGGRTPQQFLANKYGVSRSQISKLVTSSEGKEAKEEYELKKAQTMKEFKRQHLYEALELIMMGMRRIKETMPSASIHDAAGAIKIISETFDIEEAQAGTDYADMSTLAQMLKIDEGEGDGEV